MFCSCTPQFFFKNFGVKIHLKLKHKNRKKNLRFSYNPQVPPWKEFAQKTSTTHPPGDSTTVHLCLFLHWCHTSMHTVENPWEVGSSSFCQIPGGGEGGGRGVEAFRKNCQRRLLILDFISFLLTSVLEFAWGVLYLPSPLPLTPPPLCASMIDVHSVYFFWKIDKRFNYVARLLEFFHNWWLLCFY